MTANTMREAFEKWATDNLVTDAHALETYWKMYKSLWQAAQSVPVVGETDVVICDECGSTTDDPWHSSEAGSRHFHRCDTCHAKQQTTSITAQELDALRKDAESYRRLISEAKKLGMQECVYPDCICPDGVSSGECNLGLPGAPCRNDAMQERQP